MILLCVGFIVLFSWNIWLQEKTLLDYTYLFSPSDYQKNAKVMYTYFKEKCLKKKCKPWILTKKIDEIRNYHLAGVKHNELISKKHKKI